MAPRPPRSRSRSRDPGGLQPRRPIDLSGRSRQGFGRSGRSGFGRSGFGRGPAFGRSSGFGRGPSFGRSSGWGREPLTQRRSFRLARTGAIALVLVLFVWQCATTEPETPPEELVGATTTQPAVAGAPTIAPAAATTATAKRLDRKLPSARYALGAANVGGRILLIGGLDATRTSTSQVWSFDPATQKTKGLARFPLEVHTVAAARLGSKAVVMGGGRSTTVYDQVFTLAANGKPTKLGRLPAPRTNAVAVPDSGRKRVLLVGGYSGLQPGTDVLATKNGRTFSTVAKLLHPVRFPAAARSGSALYVIGGEYDKAVSNTVQKVDLTTGEVTDLPPLPTPLSRAAAFTLGGAVFVAGGRTPDGRSDQILRLDPQTGAVSAAGTLPEPRTDATVAVSRGVAYLFGGITTTATDTIVAVTAT